MRVLLIGNYPHDAQESMQRFASMMLSGLESAGIAAELIVPQPYFGRLKRSGTGLGKWLGYIDKFLLFPIFLRKKLSALKAQPSALPIVHICDHSNAFYTRFLQDVPHVVTCHDLLAARSARGEVPENPTRWSGRRLQEMVVKSLARARQVVCDSEATRRDVHRLIALAHDQVSVISIGFNYPYSPMPEPEARARIEPLIREPAGCRGSCQLPLQPPGFILHVGGNQWYKNRPGVLRIYARAVTANPAVPDLVMAGKPFTAEMEAYVAAHHLQERIRSVEGCGNEDLRALYSLADLLIFPSLAEGFGWPVIEAQACGCPVLCSSIEPFPEVTRGTACMHDPADEPGFATALLRLLAQPDARKHLTAQGVVNARRFAPANMIASYVECYDQLTRRFAPRL